MTYLIKEDVKDIYNQGLKGNGNERMLFISNSFTPFTGKNCKKMGHITKGQRKERVVNLQRTSLQQLITGKITAEKTVLEVAGRNIQR